MSNRIDFFEPTEARLSLPAAVPSILLDGVLCPFLEVADIVQSDWPEFGRARLVYNPAAYEGAGLTGAEEIEDELAVGKAICIRQVYNGCPPGAAAYSFPVFYGHIEGVETRLGCDGTIVEIVAKDFSANLKRVSVYGQRAGKLDGSTLFLAGADTVFNADGKPNAGMKLIEHNGYSYTAFWGQPAQAKLWGYAEVIDYLLCEYLPRGQLHTPGLGQLQAQTGAQVVRDLDVTGLSLIDALHRCCERIGLKFKFVPRCVPEGPRQAILFYRAGRGRAVELNCQRRGERFSMSKTNIARLHSKRNFWPVTHKYIGQGDFKVYEATFDLVKAWDPAWEEDVYEKFSPSTNPDFYKVKDVYRKWCLNEAGDYSGAPYNQGEAFDFWRIFQSSNFVHRHRRFWPALTADKNGKSLGYFLQVSFDNGLNWWQYLYAFNNLVDECGVWLSSDQLDVDTWIAAQKETLKFRITASVISDERLSCVVTDGPTESTAPVVERVITLPRQFKYRKVSSQSIFAKSSESSLGLADEVDDSAALFGFVRQWTGVSSEIIETFEVQTPYLALSYRVGDKVISSPESRDLFGSRSDNRSFSWIERVQMDFRNQCTNLKVVRRRKSRL